MADDVGVLDFLDTLPPGVVHAFAYGSGAFTQPGLYVEGSDERPMLDLILTVADPLEWHQKVRPGRCSDCLAASRPVQWTA
jgi:Phosphatidate cytidylyltransferase, mitochondrial